ncbi:helicase associated domain-containing protein [Streptomyces griseoluteus]|uniref:helicase associated domain-containing protein n=1 Tax=Streptomyces griseoluteus TaxID=29306 RepID=UPI0036FF3BC7
MTVHGTRGRYPGYARSGPLTPSTGPADTGIRPPTVFHRHRRPASTRPRQRVWQRHYAVLRSLAADEPHGILPAIAPGVQFEGDGLGKWLQRQRRSWAELSEEQQQRLTALRVKPAERPAPATAAKGTAKTSAFQRGLAALTQYIQREGRTVVGRSHIEELPDGSAIKLGVFLSNQKARRDRLDAKQRAALAELGYTWAAGQSGRS